MSTEEQKDARTPGLDEILIYDAVQRLVQRVDKQAAEIEALQDELARVRPGKFDPHPPRISHDEWIAAADRYYYAVLSMTEAMRP